jgi:hypothetical protein
MLWLICSLLYFVCLQRSGETGLYRVYEQRLAEAPTDTRRFEKISISAIRRTSCTAKATSIFAGRMVTVACVDVLRSHERIQHRVPGH